MKGKAVVVDLEIGKFDESAGDGLDPAIHDDVVDYIKEVNSKVVLSFGLLQLLSDNKVRPYDNPEKTKGETESILRLTSPEEMGQINIDQVPMIMGIDYFSGKLTAGE